MHGVAQREIRVGFSIWVKQRFKFFKSMLYGTLSSTLSAAHISAEHICLAFQVQAEVLTANLSLFLSSLLLVVALPELF